MKISIVGRSHAQFDIEMPTIPRVGEFIEIEDTSGPALILVTKVAYKLLYGEGKFPPERNPVLTCQLIERSA